MFLLSTYAAEENAKQLHNARLQLAPYFHFPNVVGSTVTLTFTDVYSIYIL